MPRKRSLAQTGTRVFQETEAAVKPPTIRELHEQYKPIVLAAVMEDVPISQCLRSQ